MHREHGQLSSRLRTGFISAARQDFISAIGRDFIQPSCGSLPEKPSRLLKLNKKTDLKLNY